MHSDVRTDKIDRLAEEIRSEIIALPEFRKLQAPNPYHATTFDDYLLFTRVIKQIAKAMCIVGRPTDVEIAEMTLSTILPSTVACLKKLKTNEIRRKHKIENILRSAYQLDWAESAPVIVELLNGPLA